MGLGTVGLHGEVHVVQSAAGYRSRCPTASCPSPVKRFRDSFLITGIQCSGLIWRKILIAHNFGVFGSWKFWQSYIFQDFWANPGGKPS